MSLVLAPRTGHGGRLVYQEFRREMGANSADTPVESESVRQIVVGIAEDFMKPSKKLELLRKLKPDSLVFLLAQLTYEAAKKKKRL